MALAFANYFLNVRVWDGANETRRRYQLTSADDAAATTDAAALVAALVAIIDGTVIGYTIEKQFDEASPATPSAGVQVENNLRLTLGIDGAPRKSATLDVPSPKATDFVSTTGPNSNVGVVASGAVATFVGFFVAGTGKAAVSDGEFVSANTARWKGKRVHHASTHG